MFCSLDGQARMTTVVQIRKGSIKSAFLGDKRVFSEGIIIIFRIVGVAVGF